MPAVSKINKITNKINKKQKEQKKVLLQSKAKSPKNKILSFRAKAQDTER